VPKTSLDVVNKVLLVAYTIAFADLNCKVGTGAA
jgi:hypothetical protein